MAATLTPDLDVIESPSPEAEPLPLVNPITVSMALAIVFLVAVLTAVSVRPPSTDDTRSADEAPAAVADARSDG